MIFSVKGTNLKEFGHYQK